MNIQLIMGQALFLSAVVVSGLTITRLFRLELSLSCLCSGVLAGLLLPWLEIDTGIRASNIHDLVFYVLLPALIFEAAWHLKPSLLKRWLSPILVLSTLGMLISCAVVAIVLYFMVAEPAGFPWVAALLAAAILAATDPIAVVSSLKKLNAPDELTTLVEGESLFNDASALVLFGVILSFATNSKAHLDSTFLSLFLVTFLGGLLVGSLLGLAVAILTLLIKQSSASNILLVFLAFSSFFVAEHIFHVSGIMSVVSAAIVSKILLREHEQHLLCDVLSTWNWLALFFNALIFVLMGLVITFDMFSQQWLAIAIAIPAALFGRLLAVFGCNFLSGRFIRPIPLGWRYILVWGGLRGAIAIVLVLSLPIDLPYWWTIQSMVFGVVLFSMLVQGSTTHILIRRYASADRPTS